MTEVRRRVVTRDEARQHALLVSDLTVRYGEVVALERVSCSAAPGRVLAVTGPSGAGKSTLLWAMAGLLGIPDADPLALRGEPASRREAARQRELASRRQVTRRWGRGPAAAGVTVTGRIEAPPVGSAVLVPQGNGLASVLTAEENCLVPLVACGVPAAEARARVARALADVGLEESAGHLIEELSGGQQQRVAVARALAMDPAILIADEPTSELDHTNRERVLALLRAVADRGGTVVMATHDPEAALIGEGELHLDAGRVVVR